MSVRKNVTLLLASGLLLTLASCGNDTKSKSRVVEANPVCSEIDCLSSVNWKIVLQGKSFPDNSRIDINGTTVLNECVSKQKYFIDRATEPQSLYLDNFYVPKRGELKIDVVDLGHNCDEEAMFLSDENVNFEVNKDFGVSEIHISL